MKLKIVSILLFIIVIHKKANGQDSILEQKEDTLQSPFFYSIAPKLINVSIRLTPQYNARLNNTNIGDLEYKNEFVTSINLLLPLVIDKKGYYINGIASYQNYNYQVHTKSSIQHENYALYGFGFQVIKQFNIADRKFILNNTLNTGMTDFIGLKNIRCITSLTTAIKLKNDDVLLIGAVALFDKEIKVPAVPVINYSTWISKPHGLLFSFNFPNIDINTTKVFNNNTFLKGGIGLLSNGHYVKSADYPFLIEHDDYKLRKIQFTFNTKFERTIYKGIWFGSELGYAYNYQTGLTIDDTYIQLDDSNNPNGLYMKCSLFIRPVTNRLKKK